MLKMNEFYCIVLFSYYIILCTAQHLRTEKLSKIFGDESAKEHKHHTYNVAFPMPILNDEVNSTIKGWRSAATKCQSLIEHSDSQKAYVRLSKAQDQEDIWLYENWFYGMKDGVILESGALDGMLYSTSLMFEKFANWTALHVEADPENYADVLRNRPTAINVNGALCSEPRLLHYVNEGINPVRGFIEFMPVSFVRQWHRRIHRNRTAIDELPTVQCLPVSMLLSQLAVKHVDLWILDTEGAEESVLKGTDFEAVHFNAVAMECDEHDIKKNKRKTDILENNNFKCTLVERNCMCKHNDYVPSSAVTKSRLKRDNGQVYRYSSSA